MMFDIDPALKHCQHDVDEAIRMGDIERLKAILAREGLEWVERELEEKDMIDDDRQIILEGRRYRPIA